MTCASRKGFCGHFPIGLLLLLSLAQSFAETVRVATYNVENYLESRTKTRRAKSAEAKAKVHESILALKPDIIALQEIGGENALEEIQAALMTNGLNLPNRLLVSGFDTNVHIALLSRYPFAATRAHTSESFLIRGKRFHVGRGFAEVDVQINSNHVVTIIGAHLKSKRQVAQADEEELRIEEAKILRERIDELLAANPAISLIVMGDLNDSKDAPSTKTIIGTGKNKLLDVRPAERSGAHIPKHELDSREITWTHFFNRDDVYSRLDYILLSPAIAHHILRDETFVLALPDWGIASDHRPIVVSLTIDD